ncbi:MAG: hypothetical protein GXX96_14805 [Planctomycetaceae bacterium]|nr:hypothetical protein [Planctomycetaceae bacterium]
MTSIFYPDCSSISGNSRWKATAVSPHNGSILRRDGTSAEDEFGYVYREHQSEFRYRLQAEDGSIIWERWQSPNEDSPHELIVADDGTVVARTHGFRPELIVIRRDGQITIRVAIESTDAPDDREGVDGEAVWVDTMQCTTAGNFWTSYSWPYFLSSPRGQLFVWRTSSGQRIVIDPVNGLLIPAEGVEYDGIADLLDTTERQETLNLLVRVCEKKPLLTHLLKDPGEEFDNAAMAELSRVSAAVIISGFHRVREAIPSLKNLEDLDWPSYSTSTTGMRGYSIEVQYLRPLIQHSLKLMDEVPARYPCYYFTSSAGRYPVKTIERRAQELRKLGPRMKPKDVLNAVGTPDYVHDYSVKSGRFYTWQETWEYDEFDGQEWVTTVLLWKEKMMISGSLVSVETVEASWKRSPDRLRDILQH